MSDTMYAFSSPVILHHFDILQKILKKAAANAAERKIDPQVFFQARLAPDMYPLAKQIQIASDVTKGGIARLAGVDIPSYADTESNFDELDARIQKTIDFIKSVPADKINGSEKKTIKLKVGGNDLEFIGIDYLQKFVIPNFYFHVSMAYAILRAQGVPLGKADFLGSR